MNEETTKKLTLSLNPKKSRVPFPHAEPLLFEKPGTGADLTLIARFIPIPGAVRCSQPPANLFRWVNWSNYYRFIENAIQKYLAHHPLLHSESVLCPPRKDQRKDINKQIKMYQCVAGQPWFPLLDCLYQDGVCHKTCPLERHIPFGMHQYVILNRQLGFW